MAKPSFKRTFDLVQHTPLIHFQRDTGATLRSTEVKAKLDSYLLSKASDEEKAVLKKCLINPENNPDTGLDYKMHIRVLQSGIRKPIPANDRNNFPMFFANMGKEYNDGDRIAISGQQLRLELFSFHGEELLKIIDSHIANFFAATNFGMRSTKGYGGYYLNPSDENYKNPINVIGNSYDLQFTVPANDAIAAMKKVELFYKFLRSGINLPGGKNTFIEDGEDIVMHRISRVYCKPVIFFYAKEKKQQWDKRSIKESLLNKNFKTNNIYKKDKNDRDNPIFKDLVERFDIDDEVPFIKVHESNLKQQEDYYEAHNNHDSPLHKHPNVGTGLLYRDLFGLSTDQEWGSYDKTILKEHAATENKIERIPSPITIKLLKEGEGYSVFFLVKEPEKPVLPGSTFNISIKNSKDTRLQLSFPADFTWKDFFDFLKDKKRFDFNRAFTEGKDQQEYHTVNKIVQQIQPQ